MNNTKPFYASLTFWGALVTAASALVQAAGLGEITTEEQAALAERLTYAGEVIGIGMVIVGRWRANKPLRAVPEAKA